MDIRTWAIPASALAFLSFSLAMFLAETDTFPAEYYRNALSAGKAVIETVSYRDPLKGSRWHQTKRRNRGVTIFDSTNAYNGFTIYTSGDMQGANLIDMTGRVAHSWEKPFRDIAPRRLKGARNIYCRKAHVFPNGDIILLYVCEGRTPWGLGLAKLTRDSELIWSYNENVHHDFVVLPDGHICVLTNAISNDQICSRKPKLRTPLLEDYVVELSAEGTELRKVSLYQALCRSPYSQVFEYADAVLNLEKGEYLHANDIDIITESQSKVFPHSTSGDILVSFREPGFVGVLNFREERIMWGMLGPWRRQHDPDILSDGTMLVYDNLGNLGNSGGASRILRIDPTLHSVTWMYQGSETTPFFSKARGSQQRLPNANILITQSQGGRLFEITEDHQICWEYINPTRDGRDSSYVPVVCWGTRISVNEFDSSFLEQITK